MVSYLRVYMSHCSSYSKENLMLYAKTYPFFSVVQPLILPLGIKFNNFGLNVWPYEVEFSRHGACALLVANILVDVYNRCDSLADTTYER